MTSEPLPAECAAARRRLAEGDAEREALDHLADCQGCSAFGAALVELEARLARLPLPEPADGAADRAIARFRAEFTAHGRPGISAVAPALTPPPSPSAGTGPPAQAPPARPPRAGYARNRRWRPRLSLAAGVAAVIALVAALVTALGTTSTPPAYAAILHQAAVHTGAEKSFRFDLTGAIGLSLRGQNTTAAVTGTGATVLPDRGQLTEASTILGRPLLRQDIVSIGNQAWTRTGGGRWVEVQVPPDHGAVDQALDDPAQALNDITRIGSGYRELGTTTVGGTQVRRIQVTIPGGSFHAFGNILSEHVSRWTVVVDVSQASLILRQLTVTGHGVVSVLGTQVPFSYSLQLTLRDFGARVSIQPPVTGR